MRFWTFLVSFVLIAPLTLLSAKASPYDVILSLDQDGAQAIEWRDVTIDLNRLLPYYTKADARPIFIENGKLSTIGAELVVVLGRSAEDGLDSKDYIELAFGALGRLEGDEDAAGAELALAQAFLRYARDLHTGRSTPSMNATDIVIDKKTIDPAKWLSVVQKNGVATTVQALRPRHSQYARLKSLLAKYRKLSSLGGWSEVAPGPALKPGMVDPRVGELRASLAARGYKNLAAGDPNTYDANLKDAVLNFQNASGLDADGVAGKGTLLAMNSSADKRINQIVVNMERWRWLPAELGSRHVMVNQAGFELFLVDGGKVTDNRRVIVGKPFHKTPMFSDKIGYVEFNPTWTVTPDIASAEFLPKLIKDPGYLEQNDYKIYAGWGEGAAEMDPYSVDWTAVRPGKFPYRIVQQPGDRNALGYVKFMFPNKRNIYLHDTPSRQLFASTGRAFSHGCIRVSDALGFAEKLLGMDQKMSRAVIDAKVDARALTRVPLKTKVPIHLAYFTVWVGPDGTPKFFQDIYERDRLVASIIFGES
ncbi:MAG: L,D-transpeptidase family protein [Rhizobiaceae bacterium]